MPEALSLKTGDERSAYLCELHHSPLFRSGEIVEILSSAATDDPNFCDKGYAEVSMEINEGDEEWVSLNDDQRKEAQECLASLSIETDSYRANDKTGLHSKLGDSCALRLDAREDRFFAQEKVAVLSEANRNRSSPLAHDSMSATETPHMSTLSFEGNISCANERGTGRTCDASAMGCAVAFLNECQQYSGILNNASPKTI